MLDMYLATRFRFFTQHTSKSALATLGKLCEFHRKKAKRKKGETPKSLFYFSFRPLTKFPIADLGVWRSGSGRRATIEQVQLCVHSRKIAFFVNLQNPDLLSPGPANVGEISPGSAGHSLVTGILKGGSRRSEQGFQL